MLGDASMPIHASDWRLVNVGSAIGAGPARHKRRVGAAGRGVTPRGVGGKIKLRGKVRGAVSAGARVRLMVRSTAAGTSCAASRSRRGRHVRYNARLAEASGSPGRGTPGPADPRGRQGRRALEHRPRARSPLTIERLRSSLPMPERTTRRHSNPPHALRACRPRASPSTPTTSSGGATATSTRTARSRASSPGWRRIVGGLVFLASVDPSPGAAQHKLPPGTEVIEMPWVGSLSNPLDVVRMMAGSIRRFWRVLDRVDAVWLVGSYLVSFVFAAARGAAGKAGRARCAPGPAPVRAHAPSRAPLDPSRRRRARGRLPAARARVPDRGRRPRPRPELPRRPLAARALGVAASRRTTSSAATRRWRAPTTASCTILSVGRLDPEKNPLLLADVLARLSRDEGRWRLVVCGDGPLEGALADRLAELGVGGQCRPARLRRARGRPAASSTAPATCSCTSRGRRGSRRSCSRRSPSGLPIVATAVGGVPDGVGARRPPDPARRPRRRGRRARARRATNARFARS